MNMPKTMTQNNYDKISGLMFSRVKLDGQELTFRRSKVVDSGVSVDGSWHRLGYSSINCIVTAISIDIWKFIRL